MSRVVLICLRDDRRQADPAKLIRKLGTTLVPDDLLAPTPLILTGSGLTIGIVNPNSSIRTRDTSVCLGALVGAQEDWWQPGAAVPDGCFALFRADGRCVELVTDILASRTIWYAHTPELFVAATSQRAIVTVLGDFSPNPEAFSWMLATGTLGPGLSWDRRVRCLRGDTRLTLDRRTWTLTEDSAPVEFTPKKLSPKDHQENLRRAMEYVFEHLDLDYSRWPVLLSGGVDSRGVLLMLRGRADLKCITCGLRARQSDEHGDAYIAKLVATDVKAQHRYFATDVSYDATDQLLRRFLVAGEGRIDQLPGFFVTSAFWRSLFDAGLPGVIRGDEALGFSRVVVSSQVLPAMRVFFLHDYRNLPDPRQWPLPPQTWPEFLRRRGGESPATWRDRLYQQVRIPYFLTGLADQTCGYLEVANPLLCRAIVAQIRTVPDSLRTRKVLFRRIVRSVGPRIPFARHRSEQHISGEVRRPQLVASISRELDTDHARQLLSPQLVDFLLGNMPREPASKAAIRSLKLRSWRYLPDTLSRFIAHSVWRRNVDVNLLAFRAYIVSRMDGLLSHDASQQVKV